MRKVIGVGVARRPRALEAAEEWAGARRPATPPPSTPRAARVGLGRLGEGSFSSALHVCPPQTRGAEHIYQTYIEPQLIKHEVRSIALPSVAAGRSHAPSRAHLRLHSPARPCDA